MADNFTLTDVNTYPQGTSVAAYPTSNWPQSRVNTAAAPLGSATNTQTMGVNGLTFTGLVDKQEYVAYAQVNGVHRYVTFIPRLFDVNAMDPASFGAAMAAKADTSSLAAVDNSSLEIVGGVLRTKHLIKTADETVNNSNTLQDDDHLQFAIGANETWFFDMYLHVLSVSTASDFKVGFSLPAGASFLLHYPSGMAGVAVASSPNQLVATSLSVGSGAFDWPLGLVGWITSAGTAGTAKFQWAQNTATAENTILKTGSIMRLRKAA